MLTSELLQFLFRYNLWADLRLLDACGALTHEQFTRDLGSSFKSVRGTLVHLHRAGWVWNERFQGRSPSGPPAAYESSDLAEVRAKLEEMDRYYLDFVSKLHQQDLERVVRYKSMAGEEFSNPLWQSLHQLSNHGTYHRGQVATQLRQLGEKTVSTDLIGFYREQAARASA